MKKEQAKLLKQRMKMAEKILKGGYDDKVVNEVDYDSEDYEDGNRRVIDDAAQAKAMEDMKTADVSAAVEDQIASASIGKQDQAYSDLVELSNKMKDKIREVANMNTMGNVQLGLGEAWYQGQGHDDDHFPCPHCGGKLMINKLKKKLYKRKVRRNKAKGKGVPKAPKFMRKEKKRTGPKAGAVKSVKQTEWMDYCKAVGKTPKMQGKPWNKVMKKASKLKKEGVTLADIKSIRD